MSHYSKDTINKIGNAIIYISQKTPSLSKTKLLKLLYLLEENSAMMFHTPFFGIEFKVWQHGPVAGEVFIDLSNDLGAPRMLRDHVDIEPADNGFIIKGKGTFDDSEFSDNDIEVMDHVIMNYGNKTANQLVKELHKKGSAWHTAAKENGLLELFEKNMATSSEISVDVTCSLNDDARERYKETIHTWEEMAKFKM